MASKKKRKVKGPSKNNEGEKKVKKSKMISRQLAAEAEQEIKNWEEEMETADA